MTRFQNIDSLQSALKSGTITCQDLVTYYLAQIQKTKDLNAYIEVWEEEAMAKALETDLVLKNDPDSLGALFGVVVSIKDNICYANHVVTAGSKILEGFHSLYSATAVERILAAGAIIIGRTNCDQFGMGSSNENSVYGSVKNAKDPNRISGGSSGGAAVSVQADTCMVALGSDTGGSVRQPAGFCGIYGFKPTYGRISRHGLIAYGSSFDQIGILAHHPQDIRLLLKIMAGPDEYDATCLTETLNLDVSPRSGKAKIAYLAGTLDNEAIDEGVRTVMQTYVAGLRAVGHEVSSVAFDYMDYIIPTYYVLTTAEASSNLARFDGVRYGHRSSGAKTLEENYQLSRTEGFSEEVKRRILLGTFVLSSGYYDAYYTKAQQSRRLIRARTLEILVDYDFILMPVAPTVAWRFGEKSDDPVAMYLSDIYTVLANLAGIPALAVPIGIHPDHQMPVGIQWMSGLGAEGKLLDMFLD